MLNTRMIGLMLAISFAASCGDDSTSLEAEAATERLVDEVLPDVVPLAAPFQAIRVADLVEAGSVIVPDAPMGLGTGPGQDPLPPITPTEPSHLFVVDLHPNTYFAHRVKYVLMGESGAIRIEEANWLPKVDGTVPPELTQIEPDPELVAASRLVPVVGTGTTPTWTLAPWLDVDPTEGYIVVQGLLSNEVLFSDARATGLAGKAFFDAYASDDARVDLLEEGAASTVLDVMDEMANEGRSPIVVAIIAHGGIDSVGLGGQGVTAQQLVQRVRAHSDTTFSFLIGSCGSGSFVDDLRQEPNVRVVATAVGPNEGATPDWDNSPIVGDANPTDTGSEWFSSYYQAAGEIVGDSGKMDLLRDLAGAFGVGQTDMLLCQAVYGATGYNQLFLPSRINFDLSHILGYEDPVEYGTHTPIRYCSWF